MAAHSIGAPGGAVLDVRTPAEFAAGHIEGAVNLDANADDFEAKLKALDRDAPYLLHCASGGRSRRALAAMEPLAFERVYHLAGGYIAWQEMKRAASEAPPCSSRRWPSIFAAST